MSTQTLLTCYTRTPLHADVYSEKLAYSVHLALGNNAESYVPLNEDSGVFFAAALSQEDGTLKAKSFKNPILFKGKEQYGLIVRRVEANGELDEDYINAFQIYQTDNFTEYNYCGDLILDGWANSELVDCQYDQVQDQFTVYGKVGEQQFFSCSFKTLSALSIIHTEELATLPSPSYLQWERADIKQGNTIEIDEQAASYLLKKLGPVYHIETSVPAEISVESIEAIATVQAKLTYSDGSIAYRSVEWDTDKLNVEAKHKQALTGRVRPSYFSFPIATHRADPNIIYYKGMYYFIATDDTTGGNLNLYVRAAHTIADITAAEEQLILNHKMYPEINKFLWAPEFHVIGDRLYILFASSPQEFGEIRCHTMRLKENGDITNQQDWEYPNIFLQQDGSELFSQGITLDMTYVELDGQHYVMWAQRQLKPVDTGSWLYIATVSAEKPWQLTSDPVLISKPEYGWANNQTFVDEGPFAIVREDKLYVTFSSALVNATYCVGLLSINRGDNILEASNWKKCHYPILTSRTIEGQFGPGHNSYVKDLDGTLLNVYHAKPDLNGPRSTGIRPVHFGFDGEPILKMTESQFINESMQEVQIEVTFKS